MRFVEHMEREIRRAGLAHDGWHGDMMGGPGDMRGGPL